MNIMFDMCGMSIIENINIFQNLNDKRYDSASIIFRDNEGKPKLLYIEKVEKSMNVTSRSGDPSLEKSGYFMPTMDFFFEAQLRPAKDNTVFRIIELSFEEPKPKAKEMTKEQIEKALGYKIKII